MRICLIEPYDTGSHQSWLEGYAKHSRHTVVTLTLKGAFWKWRMHGGAVTLARRYLERDIQADLILASDMLDLTTFLALTRPVTSRIPVALYMHENQLTYPTRPGEKRDLHYGFINYASMMCADAILFNSRYHMDAWFDELPRLLKHFPDHNELGSIARLRDRAQVLPLGLDLQRFDPHRIAREPGTPPLIVWNHRWEYDKNPEGLFSALDRLAARGVAFEVAVIGEHFVRVPEVFANAQERLGNHIVQFGYAETFAEYARWLWRADITISTAIHDFFGASVAEAIYCGCMPLLPNRLAYPQFVPKAHRDICLYDSEDELVDKLGQALLASASGVSLPLLRDHVAGFDWASMAPRYDGLMESLP